MALADVDGDGHCQRRCFASLLYGMGADTPETLRQMQYVLAGGLEKFAGKLDAMVAKFAQQDNFKDYCLSRAQLLRGINSSQPCSSHEWGGGEHGCDNFVLAALLKGRVIMSTPNTPTLTVYNSNFEATVESISEYILQPGDFLIT
jgi:hypothetical protein